jgi:hypothetical protein
MTAERKVVVDGATLARAKHLQSLGFVHVTGLRAWGPSPNAEPYKIQACRDQLGCWNYNNGKLVLITKDGEVWLGAGMDPCDLALLDIVPNGKKGFVPCSNGEQLATHAILRRVTNPYDDFRGENSPVPEIKD